MKANVLIFFLLVFQFVIFGQAGQIGYSVESVLNPKKLEVTETTNNLLVFKDIGVELVIPENWTSINDGEGYQYDRLKNKKSWTNVYGDQVWVWKRPYYSSDPIYMEEKIIEDLIISFSPLHEHVETYKIKVKKAPNVIVYVWKATHISNGEQKPFKIYAAYNIGKFASLKGNPILFGRSSGESNEKAMLNDFIVMAERLSIYYPSEKENTKSKLPSDDKMDEIMARVVENVKKKWEYKRLVADSLKVNIDLFKYDFQKDINWTRMEFPSFEKDAQWKTPSFNTRFNPVVDAVQVSQNRLLTIFKRGITMTDIKNGSLLWYMNPDLTNQDVQFIRSEDSILYLSEDNQKFSLFSTHIDTGEEIWRFDLPNKPTRTLYDWDSDTFLCIKEDKRETAIKVFDMKTGKERWETVINHSKDPDNYTYAKVLGNQILFIRDVIGMRDITDGSENWVINSINLDDKSPDPHFLNNNIILIDTKKKIYQIDLKTGMINKSINLDENLEYTNIQSGSSNIYVRGASKSSKKRDAEYHLIALNSEELNFLWDFKDSIETLSNIIEEGTRTYVANWQGPLALDSRTGKLDFRKHFSEYGKSFPVSLRKYNNTLVFEGELVIAGINLDTSQEIYLNKFDPISQVDHFDAIDPLIDELYEYLKFFGKPALKGVNIDLSGGYLSDLGRSMQERSNKEAYQARQDFLMAGSYGKTSTGVQYYNKGKLNYWKSQISSSIAKAQYNGEIMINSVGRAANAISKMTKPERERFIKLQQKRNKLSNFYDTQTYGDYAIRRSEKVVKGQKGTLITFIKLETGKSYSKFFDKELKVPVFLNPELSQFYFVDMLPINNEEDKTETGKKVIHGYYFVAHPLLINELEIP